MLTTHKLTLVSDSVAATLHERWNLAAHQKCYAGIRLTEKDKYPPVLKLLLKLV